MFYLQIPLKLPTIFDFQRTKVCDANGKPMRKILYLFAVPFPNLYYALSRWKMIGGEKVEVVE